MKKLYILAFLSVLNNQVCATLSERLSTAESKIEEIRESIHNNTAANIVTKCNKNCSRCVGRTGLND